MSSEARRYGPFSALGNHNFRLYFTGHVLSFVGTHMQRVTTSWLILEITGSPTALGLMLAAQYTPALVLSLTAGVLVDRWPRRKVMLVSQTALLLQALALAALTFGGGIQPWQLGALAFALGIANTFDGSARRTIAADLVEREYVQSAISMSKTGANLARIAGPAIGALVIVAFGPAWCFVFNAVSYLFGMGALLLMRTDRLQPFTAPEPGSMLEQIKDGMRYVRGNAQVRLPLTLQLFIGMFGDNFITFLPLIAIVAFQAGPGGLGALSAAQGIGTVIGAVLVGGAPMPTSRSLLLSATGFTVLLLAVAGSPDFVLTVALVTVMLVVFAFYDASTQTALLLGSQPEYRGRMLSFYTLMSAGSLPLGATLTGILADLWGVRVALGIDAVLCLVGVVVARLVARR